MIRSSILWNVLTISSITSIKTFRNIRIYWSQPLSSWTIMNRLTRMRLIHRNMESATYLILKQWRCWTAAGKWFQRRMSRWAMLYLPTLVEARCLILTTPSQTSRKLIHSRAIAHKPCQWLITPSKTSPMPKNPVEIIRFTSHLYWAGIFQTTILVSDRQVKTHLHSLASSMTFRNWTQLKRVWWSCRTDLTNYQEKRMTSWRGSYQWARWRACTTSRWSTRPQT